MELKLNLGDGDITGRGRIFLFGAFVDWLRMFMDRFASLAWRNLSSRSLTNEELRNIE